MAIDTPGYIRAVIAAGCAVIKLAKDKQPSTELESLSAPVREQLEEIVRQGNASVDADALLRLESALPHLVYDPGAFAQCGLDCGRYAEELADRLASIDQNFKAATCRATAITVLRLTFESVLADPRFALPLQMATYRLLLAAVAREKGVPEAPLRAVLARFGEESVPPDDIPGRLAQKADELVLLRAELARLRNDRPEFAAIRDRALGFIDKGLFDEAREELRRGRRLAQELRQEYSRVEAGFLLEEARLDRLNLDYDAALRAYGEATRLAPDNLFSWGELGDLWVRLGNLTEAGAVYEKAAVACQRLGDIRNLSVSHDRIGDVRRAQGDLAGALKAYEAGLAIAFNLATSDPRNAGWQRDLSVSHNKIGDVRVAQGDLAGALNAYETGLAIAFNLATSDPRNGGWQRDLSVSHNRIGDVRVTQGDLAGALNAYKAGLAIREKLATSDPRNAEWQRDLSVSHNRIGDVRVTLGDLAGALKAYEAGHAIAFNLATSDPRNAGWQRDLSLSHSRIGDVRRAQGDLAGALKAYEACLAIREKLTIADPSNAGWQRDLSYSLTVIATIREKQGELALALAGFEASLAINEKLVALDPTNAMWKKDVEISRRNVALVKAKLAGK